MLKISKRLDIIGLIKDLTIKVESGITKSVNDLKEKIDDYTPERTGELLSNNTIKPTEIQGSKVIGSIYNDTEYAHDVEYGLEWAKNYHKPKGTVYFKSGEYKGLQGNRGYTRATDEMEQEIVINIKQSLKGL